MKERGVGIESVVKPKGWGIGATEFDWQLPDDHDYAMAEMHWAHGEDMHSSIEKGLIKAIKEHERTITNRKGIA